MDGRLLKIDERRFLVGGENRFDELWKWVEEMRFLGVELSRG